jgi:sugar/nucleoside kinase (ribokinase family)
VTCHVILEGGAKSPGDGDDALFLLDPYVQERIGFLGLEPVVFADERTGRVSEADAESCTRRLAAVSASLDFVSPDMALFQEIDPFLWNQMEVGIRNGPKGSLLLERDGSKTIIPAAALVTFDGLPVNPTGAGNGYAAAFTACRGSGASAVDSACIASAIGAVFCEYDHIPVWNASVLRRIRQAADEICNKVSAEEKLKG